MHFNIFWTVIMCAQLHHQIVELFQSSNFYFSIYYKSLLSCTANAPQILYNISFLKVTWSSMEMHGQQWI